MSANNDDQRYLNALKRVEEIKNFYSHLATYILVNVFLLILNLTTSPKHLWFFWPLIGWGIGLFFHFMKAFQISPFLNKEWEERKIRQFLEEDQKNTTKWQ